MPKWKKDETEFTVHVNFQEKRGYQTPIPPPIVKKLGTHESILESGITFLIKGKKIEIVHRPESKPKAKIIMPGSVA